MDEILKSLFQITYKCDLSEEDEDALNKAVNVLEKQQKEIEELKETNKALYTLVDWATECDFGYDNFTENDDGLYEEIEKELDELDYIEGMIYYAKKYNEKMKVRNKYV